MLTPCRILFDGSSPRAWGTPEEEVEPGTDPRFIPTCMGNSDPPGRSSWTASVHPHVHGELGQVCHPSDCMAGSSPRAWGTQERLEILFDVVRFIPTCMGNSMPWAWAYC